VVIAAGTGLAVLPLAEKAAPVTALLERLGDRHLLGRQVLIVAPHAGVNRVLASQEGPAAGTTDRCRRIAVPQNDAISRQAIEMRSGPLRSPIETDVAPAQVVGNDEDDVRCPLSPQDRSHLDSRDRSQK